MENWQGTDEEFKLNDLVFGERDIHRLSVEGDFVVEKSCGNPTYHLASVVDDHLMDITHVVRGEDWLTSLHKHLQLYRSVLSSKQLHAVLLETSISPF